MVHSFRHRLSVCTLFLLVLLIVAGCNTVQQSHNGSEIGVTSRLSLKGLANRLEMSLQRREVLVATVRPDGNPKVGEEYGLYTFSLHDPKRPESLGYFSIISPLNFVLSHDGQTAYVMNTWFHGYPKENQYGLLVIDISAPGSPSLLSYIPGDFMTIGLSGNGQYLFLQERNTGFNGKTYAKQNIRVYSTKTRGLEELCRSPFQRPRDPENRYPPFAYSFLTFSDDDMLGIVDHFRRILFFDIATPCQPRFVYDIDNEDDGMFVAGWKHGWLITGAGGLATYHVSNPSERKQAYEETGASEIRVFGELGLMTANDLRKIRVFSMDEDPSFSKIDTYSLPPYTGDAFIANSSTMYVGGTGALWTLNIRRPSYGPKMSEHASNTGNQDMSQQADSSMSTRPSLYAAAEIEGGWHTDKGTAQERDTMTLRHLGEGQYQASVRTVYCPSVECMNARFGEVWFKSRLDGDSLKYKTTSCDVRIEFSPRRAVVHVQGCKKALPYGGPRGPCTRFSENPDWAVSALTAQSTRTPCRQRSAGMAPVTGNVVEREGGAHETR